MRARLIGDNGVLELPFVPKFDIESDYDDVEFKNIKGENYLIPGDTKLRTVEISGFISNKPLDFYNNNAPKTLQDFKTFFTSHRQLKKPLQLVVADKDTTILIMDCLAIFKYQNKDKVGDIAYTITLREYKRVDI